MFILNLKQSLRNLRRNHVYTYINGAGLCISTAFILLVTVYVIHAVTMDRFSPALKNIYRVETTELWKTTDTTKQNGFFDWLAKGADVQNQLVTPLVLGEDLKRNFPEINSVCRLQSLGGVHFSIGSKSFKGDENNIGVVDENFFSFFPFQLLNRTTPQAFSDVHSVVLTEAAAKKYFGSENPVGKVVSLREYDNSLFTVSAVAKNFPKNSSIQFDMLFCLQGMPDYNERMQSGINQSSFLTLLQLREGSDVIAFKKKLAVFGENYLKDWVALGKKFHPELKDPRVNLAIRPYSDAHFNSSQPWFYYTDLKAVFQLIFLAMIALGIACINYVLLSLSRVAVRSHEAGIRKTVGAGWKHIISMFLTETGLLVFLSMLAGFVLAIIALPYFNELTKVSISITEIINPKFIAIAAGLSLVLTVIAGIHPAIKMAGIKPLSVVSKFGTYKLNPLLSKVFITLQYTACIVLIVFSIVIARQINFARHKDLGFDKDQTLLVQNPYWGNREKTTALRSELYHWASTQPAIAGVTASTFRYGVGGNNNGHNIEGKKVMIRQMTVDYDYFELNKIPIVKGRSFSSQMASDTTRFDIPKSQLDSLGSQMRSNLIVNETLYAMLGQPELNTFNRSLGGFIVGVCKDYFFEGLQQKIGPDYHMCGPDRVGYFWFKISKGQNLASIVNALKAFYNKDTNGEDFSYSFVDDDVKVLYESNERWLKVISFASWMAIFIACLGLFGLSAVVAVSRTKEIGIRKVLGATVLQLFLALNKQSFTMVWLSIVIAVPIAFYISSGWLHNFAYRIEVSWIFFVIAALIGFVCAIIAVSYNTIKAALANPVESLRTE
jgi:putative ABC transport system permease protein